MEHWLFKAAIIGGLAAVGCGGASPVPVREPAASRPADAPAPEARRATSGSALEVPVLRCGPDDSYHYVSQEFRCPSGANPLAGRSGAARSARRGSLRDPRTGHFVDVYEIPCQPSPVRLYVDMYGCAEYARRLKAPESAESKRVRSDFAANRFQAVVNRCASVFTGKELGDAGSRCLTVMPASLFLLGKHKQAVHKLGEICAAFPNPSLDSDVRARLVLETLGAIAEGAEHAHIRVDERQVAEELEQFADVCGVPPEQIERLMEPMKSAAVETNSALRSL